MQDTIKHAYIIYNRYVINDVAKWTEHCYVEGSFKKF